MTINEVLEKKFYLILYEYETGKIEVFLLNLSNVTSMSTKIIPNGSSSSFLIGLGNYSGSLNLFSGIKISEEKNDFISSTQEIEKLHNYKINCLDFSAISQNHKILLATGSNDRKIHISSLSFSADKSKLLGIQILYKFTYFYLFKFISELIGF